MADETPLDRFERRVGRTHFRQRFYMQVDHIAKLY